MFKSTGHLNGVTLIECLVALALSVLLSSILLTLSLTATRHHRAILAYQSLQDNAVFALRLLTDTIQRAGEIGCARLTTTFPLQGELTPANRLTGTEDQLTVRGGGAETGYLQTSMSTTNVLFVAGDLPVLAGDRLIISDCRSADIFQVRTVEKIQPALQKIIAATPLSTRYPVNAEIRSYAEITFFAAPTHRHDAAKQAIFALYQTQHSAHGSELVTGVERVQFHYDVRQAGTVTTMTASAVTDWSQVVGVHIALQLGTPAPQPLHKMRYAYALVRE